MKLAVGIPQSFPTGKIDVDGIRGYLARAEALGFDGAWTQVQIIGRMPTLEPLTLMLFAAACTTRLRLGGMCMPADKARRIDLSGRAGRPDGVIYRQQYVRCGKPGCRRCPPTGPSHGPYWYGFYWDYRQRTRSFYVGKTLPAGVEPISAPDHTQSSCANEGRDAPT